MNKHKLPYMEMPRITFGEAPAPARIFAGYAPSAPQQRSLFVSKRKDLISVAVASALLLATGYVIADQTLLSVHRPDLQTALNAFAATKAAKLGVTPS